MRSFLADTHVVLWYLLNSDRLAQKYYDTIESNAEVYVSLASLWEVSIKVSLGKLTVPSDLMERLEENGFTILPISIQNTQTIATLPHHHGDPFDRMLIAQAVDNQLTLMSQDRHVHLYDVSLA